MRIREACIDDVEGIARVHADSWQETYVGLMPPHVIASRSFEQRMRVWQKSLSDPQAGERVFVAEDASGCINGFAKIGPKRDDAIPCSGELHTLYLLRAAQKTGTGAALFEAAMGALKEAGFTSAYCWVLAGNPAIGFYRRMGGVEGPRRFFELEGARLEDVAMLWKEI